MKNGVTIKISNRAIYTLIAILLVLGMGAGVYAYNSAYGDPSVMGHSSDEIEKVVVEGVTSDPASPAVGEMWLRTDVP